jgi:hypothetical protein
LLPLTLFDRGPLDFVNVDPVASHGSSPSRDTQMQVSGQAKLPYFQAPRVSARGNEAGGARSIYKMRSLQRMKPVRASRRLGGVSRRQGGSTMPKRVPR